MKIKTPFLDIEIETFFLILVFISIFSQNFQKYMISYYVCYLFILFHELSHMFVASILGRETESIKFTVSGVCIKITEENGNKTIKIIKNIFIYLAGPMSNILLAILFNKIKIVFEINIFLAFLNLLPIYPLDGYNIIDNILDKFYYFKLKERILNIIENTFICILFLLSIFQFIILNNISIFIFVLYIWVIKISSKKNRKISSIVKRITC